MLRDDLEQTLRGKLQGLATIAAVVRFELGADGAIVLDGKSTPPVVAATGPAAGTTIHVAAADLRDIMSGDMSAMEAYTLGKLSVDGDIGPAMKLGSLIG